MAELVVEGLRKRFDGVLAVDGVSFTVRDGEMVTLLGPSGCGKSTTLNCIAGLEVPDEGVIKFGDRILTDTRRGIFLRPEARNVGMVFQSYALWPHMTVFENLAFGLRMRRVPQAEIRRRIEWILSLLQLEGFEHRYPHQLSGGQQQRIALARALVYEPSILLLDEPLSNLDAKLREQARFWLRELQQRLRITAIYVTHDQAEALALSDRVVVMNRGRIMAIGTPREIYELPPNPFVADFIGSCNFLHGHIETIGEANRITVKLEKGIPLQASALYRFSPGQPVIVAVRPQRIRIHTDGPKETNTLPGKVESGLYLGASFQYVLETPVGTLRVEATEPVQGEVTLYLPPEWCIVLPASDSGDEGGSPADAAT
ncbi:MAG: ABC transporter ATP-binding protein [Armatimonadota bacterium]|nr:ABC transporter ATP-binding protein [Armatimonadota bacterium]